MEDNYNLRRFSWAQEKIYADVISELKASSKQSHWMWFIFPQIKGLGRSPTAKYYAILSEEEAFAYLKDPLLGARLRECTQLVLDIKDASANDIFGSPDDLKFWSCMSLFASISKDDTIFNEALAKYFNGMIDPNALF